jgi:hypothetical protein
MTRDEWERLYAEAPSMRALARQLGMSPAGVALNLRKHGIQVRNTRAATVRRKPTTAKERAGWQRQYDEAGSVSELARRLGKSGGTIRYHLRRCGVEIRSEGFASPKSVRHFGADSNRWKGGTYRRPDGYIYEYAPDHPAAGRAKGYVLQHRLVMEAKLGRPLLDTELVHHINEVKDDNRPENLEIYERPAHIRHHKATALRDTLGRFSAT